MWRSGIPAAALVLALAAPAAPQQPIPAVLAYRVVAEYPHDPEAFTQGLEFRGKALFETTGLHGESTLRRVDLETGEPLRMRSLRKKFFGEGMTIFGRKLFWLTWQHERGFVYRPRNFKRIGRFSYKGEGWGLTHNRRRLIMSNGSARIRFRDPKTFRVKRSIRVTSMGEPVDRLNELEWYKGSILANVWQTDLVARIDPKTGDVTGWLDLSALRSEEEQADDNADVTNGIAYMRSEDRLFVTGKRWANVYEIELIE
ncbi:MAG: glutaminyl-peptide cyclotransferase [Actinomycetota bacterium]